MAPPGTHSVEAKVYDVSKKVDGISPIADLMYVQAGEGQLGISRLFAVSNPSNPPRTQMNDRNFEFYLPDGVQIDQAQAQTEGGQWVDSAPVPQAEKGRYAFIFPLRPGTTQFQVSYHLPYNGSAKIDPKPLYPLEHLVVIFPRSIAFIAVQAGLYEDKQPPDQPKATAKVAANVHPGEALSFEISGTGMLQDQNSQEAGAEGGGTPAPSAAGPQTAEPRPGGGLGPPIEAPDPLDKYRPYILGGFALVLAGGAVYVAKRPRSTTRRRSHGGRCRNPGGRPRGQDRGAGPIRHAARSLERGDVHPRGRAQARQHFTARIRKGPSRARSDARSCHQAGSTEEVSATRLPGGRYQEGAAALNCTGKTKPRS